MSAILLICVLYTLFGGLKAVIATDYIQTLIIIVGVLTIGYLCIENVGLDTIHSSISQHNPQLLNLLFPAAIMFLFNNIFFGIGEIFHSNVWWSRALAFKKNIGKKAFLLSALFWLPIPIVTGFVALAAPALGIFPPSADMVGPLVAAKLVGQVGAIIVFIVVFSALASSLDSLLAATGDLIAKDVYQGVLKKNVSSDKAIIISRWAIVGLGFFTWVLCLPKITTLGALLNFTGAFVASTIWPIIFGLYRFRLNGTFASVAMIAGTLFGLIAYFAIGFYVAALVSCAVSLIVSIGGMFVTSNRRHQSLSVETSRAHS